MSTFTGDITGRYRSPDVPDDLAAWPELEAAAANLSRLEREYREDAAAEEQARVGLEDEIAGTRARMAQAKLAGDKKLPTSDGIAKAQAVLDGAKLRREAADAARRQAAQTLIQVVEENRPPWLRTALEAVDAARAEEAAALTVYLEAVEATTRAQQRAAWIERFPEKTNIKAAAPPLAYATQEPIAWDRFAHALRIRVGLVEPPARTMPQVVEQMKRDGVPLGPDGGPSPTMTPEAA